MSVPTRSLVLETLDIPNDVLVEIEDGEQAIELLEEFQKEFIERWEEQHPDAERRPRVEVNVISRYIFDNREQVRGPPKPFPSWNAVQWASYAVVELVESLRIRKFRGPYISFGKITAAHMLFRYLLHNNTGARGKSKSGRHRNPFAKGRDKTHEVTEVGTEAGRYPKGFRFPDILDIDPNTRVSDRAKLRRSDLQERTRLFLEATEKLDPEVKPVINNDQPLPVLVSKTKSSLDGSVPATNVPTTNIPLDALHESDGIYGLASEILKDVLQGKHLDVINASEDFKGMQEDQLKFWLELDNKEYQHRNYPRDCAYLNVDPSGPRIDGLDVVLQPHQVIAIAWLSRQEKGKKALRRSLLADWPGSGKSVIFWGYMLHSTRKWQSMSAEKRKKTGLSNRPTLLICPSSMTEAWVEKYNNLVTAEGKKIVKLVSYYKPVTEENPILHRKHRIFRDSPRSVGTVVLASLETWSQRHPPKVYVNSRGEVKFGEQNRNKVNIMKGMFLRVVVDEGHRLKGGRELERSAAICELEAPLRQIHTATPIVNTIRDLGGILDFLEADGAADAYRKDPSNPYREETKHNPSTMILKEAFRSYIVKLFTGKHPNPTYGIKFLRKMLSLIMLRRVAQSKIEKAVGVHTEFSKNNPTGSVSARLPQLRMHTVFCEYSPQHYEKFWEHAVIAHSLLHMGGHGDAANAGDALGSQNMGAWRALHMMSLSIRFCLPLSEWAPDAKIPSNVAKQGYHVDQNEDEQINLEQQIMEDEDEFGSISEVESRTTRADEDEEVEDMADEDSVRGFGTERALSQVLAAPWDNIQTSGDFAGIFGEPYQKDDDDVGSVESSTISSDDESGVDEMERSTGSQPSDGTFDPYPSYFELKDGEDITFASDEGPINAIPGINLGNLAFGEDLVSNLNPDLDPWRQSMEYVDQYTTPGSEISSPVIPRGPHQPESGYKEPPACFRGYSLTDLRDWRQKHLDAKMFLEATRQFNENLPKTALEALLRMTDGYPALVALTQILAKVVIDPVGGGIPGHNKVVVMCNNPQIAENLKMFLELLGLNVANLHSGLNRYERQDMLEDFNKNTHIDVLITTYSLAGVGVDMHLRSHHIVLFEPAVNSSLEDQAIGRVYRTNQQYDVMCYRIVTRGTYQIVQLLKASEKYWPIINAMRARKGPLKNLSGDELITIFQNYQFHSADYAVRKKVDTYHYRVTYLKGNKVFEI